MGLVNNQHAHSLHQLGQLPTGECGIDEAFGGYQEDIEIVSVEALGNFGPLGGIR